MSDFKVGDWVELVEMPRGETFHPVFERNIEVGDVVLISHLDDTFVGYTAPRGSAFSYFGIGTTAVYRSRWRKFELREGDTVLCISGDLAGAYHPTESRDLKEGDLIKVKHPRSPLNQNCVAFWVDRLNCTHHIYKTNILPLPRVRAAAAACTCSAQQLLWGGHTCGIPNTDGTNLLS